MTQNLKINFDILNLLIGVQPRLISVVFSINKDLEARLEANQRRAQDIYAGISLNATITLNKFNYVNRSLIGWNVNGISREIIFIMK